MGKDIKADGCKRRSLEMNRAIRVSGQDSEILKGMHLLCDKVSIFGVFEKKRNVLNVLVAGLIIS